MSLEAISDTRFVVRYGGTASERGTSCCVPSEEIYSRYRPEVVSHATDTVPFVVFTCICDSNCWIKYLYGVARDYYYARHGYKNKKGHWHCQWYYIVHVAVSSSSSSLRSNIRLVISFNLEERSKIRSYQAFLPAMTAVVQQCTEVSDAQSASSWMSWG